MLLETQNLCFKYPYTQIDVINGLSCKLAEGLILVYAPEGRGKTTLLKLLAGRYVPTGGKILIEGQDLKDIPQAERKIAYADQSFLFFPRRSVRYNLAYPLKVRGVKKNQRKQDIEALVRNSQVERLLDKKLKTLDYLQKLEVMLLRMQAIERQVVLFDDILAEAGENREDAIAKIKEFVCQNGDKVILLALSRAEDIDLFEAKSIFTLDIGKLHEGVNKDENDF